MAKDTTKDDLPTVKSFPLGWHLVEQGGWQVSVSPDGLIMLPRHLHPREAAEFCEAVLAAADVGGEVIKANDAKTTPQAGIEALSTSAFVTHTAEPTPGVKMLVQQREGVPHRSAIGRPKKTRDPRQPAAAPAAPTAPKPGTGARHGRK